MNPEHKLLAIARLKAALPPFKQKEGTGPLYDKLDRRLDDLLLEAIGHLPREPLAPSQEQLVPLIDQVKAFAPVDFIEICNTLAQEEKIKSILRRREQALQQGTDLDLTGIIDGYENIPLQFYDWEKTGRAFKELVAGFNHPEYRDLLTRCTDFFDTGDAIAVPAGFPDISSSLVKNLISRKLVPTKHAHAIVDEIQRIKTAIKNRPEQLEADFFAAEISPHRFGQLKNDAYRLLCEAARSDSLRANVPVSKYLPLWNGPGKAALLDQWWRLSPSAEKAALLAACTGVKSPEEWQAWADLAKRAEDTGREKFLGLVKKHRFVYELGFILSCRFLSETGFDDIWQPVIINLKSAAAVAEAAAQPAPVSSLSKSLKNFAVPGRSPSVATDITESFGEILTADPTSSIGVDFESGTDPDELAVSPQAIRQTNTIVEAKSTWNRYLKPFLSENLVGVLGAGLLMLAWLCISIWVWDKGQYYRLLTAALPMFLTSLGLAWLAVFFHKNLDKGVSPKAPLLFSILGILSLPFNYLIALSILLIGAPVGLMIGIPIAAIYTVAILRISTWVQPILEFSPGFHLAEINGYLLLPVLVALLPEGYGLIQRSPDVLLFLAFFATARVLFRPKPTSESSPKIKFYLLGGNCLLVIVVFCIFLKATPSAAAIALFLLLAALALSYSKAITEISRKLIVSGSLSLTGLLIAAAIASNILVLGLVLAVVMWMRLKRSFASPWLDELVAGLIYLIVPAILLANGGHWLWAGLWSFPLTAAAVLFEKKYLQEGLRVVSFTIPACILLGGAFIVKHGHHDFRLAVLGWIVVVSLGCYGYYRYALLYQKRLWFFNLSILMLLPAACVAATSGPAHSMAVLSFSVCLWAFVSPRLNDVLAYQYRTSFQFLFALLPALLFQMLWFLPELWSVPLVVSFPATMMALILSAYRSASQVPVYGLLICGGSFFYTLAKQLGFHFESGIGLALTSVSLFIAARLLGGHGLWQKTVIKDTFFGSEFPLQTPKFLVYPLEIAAWVTICLSFFKAIFNFAFITGSHGIQWYGIKIGLVDLIATYMAIQFVKRYRYRHSGYSLIAPATLVFVNFCSLVPGAWLPAFIAASLLGFRNFVAQLQSLGDTVEEIIRPLKNYLRILAYLAIPAGFLMYVYFWTTGYLWRYQAAVPITAAIVAACHHFTVVRNRPLIFTHLIPAHLVITSILGYLELTRSLPLFTALIAGDRAHIYETCEHLFYLLFLVSAIFGVLSYRLEFRSNDIQQNYARTFHQWLLATASFLACVLIAGSVLITHSLPIAFFIAGMLIVHSGNRFYFGFPLVLLKAVLAICCGISLFSNPLFGILIGIFLFVLFEYGTWLGDKHTSLRLQSVHPATVSPGDRAAWILLISIIAFLLTHLFIVAFDFAPIQHYLLYALIPIGTFVYRRLAVPASGYLAPGLFFYANGFVSLYALDLFQTLHLNIMHLLSIAITLSILTCYGYEFCKKQLERAPTP